jgi:hypothetical protein
MPILVSQHMRVLAQGLEHVHSGLWGVTLPEDVVRREANRVYSEWM